MAAVNKPLAGLAKSVVLVQDQEADIFGFFKAERAPNVDLLVQMHQLRKIGVAASGHALKLQQVAEQLPPQGTMQVEVYRHIRL